MPIPTVILQHLGWLKQYADGANDENWSDMARRASLQIDALIEALAAECRALQAEVERIKDANQKQYDEGYAHGLAFAKLERRAKGKRLAKFVMTGEGFDGPQGAE